MWIIKNRVTGEYERKGTYYSKRDRFNRNAWNTLAHAKCHVACVGYDEWFMEADFIEITDEGPGKILPVSDYLREYYGKNKWASSRVKRRLGLLPEPPEEVNDDSR